MAAASPLEAGLAEAIGLYNAGRRDEARTLCTRLLERHGAHAALDQLMAVLLQEAGEAEAAARHIERSLAARPGHAPSLLVAALVAQDRRDFGRAAAALEQVLQQQPQHVAALVNLGIVLLELGRFDDAMRRFGRAHALRPETFGRIVHALSTPATGALWLDPEALRAELRAAASSSAAADQGASLRR